MVREEQKYSNLILLCFINHKNLIMTVYSFKNDYSEWCHPSILEALSNSNLVQDAGYGEDHYCLEATQAILHAIDYPQAAIHFVSGGTQANLIVISSLLFPYESVIAAHTWHIAVHEAGAIEATGHKINTIMTKDGKLTPQDVKRVVEAHTDEHMVKPRLVFISNSTEVGTVYNKEELGALSLVCKQHGLYLYLDGARLWSALTSPYNDMSLSDIAKLVDVFYIGGTKNGALLGEAIVICNPAIQDNFRFHLKQKGALLAKGRVLGIQFLSLFTDDLFFTLGKHATAMAMKLATWIKKAGYSFLAEPVSNQIFPIFPNSLIEKLSATYGFYVWEKVDDKQSAIRLVTSWATQESAVDQFIGDLV